MLVGGCLSEGTESVYGAASSADKAGDVFAIRTEVKNGRTILLAPGDTGIVGTGSNSLDDEFEKLVDTGNCFHEKIGVKTENPIPTETREPGLRLNR